MEFIFLTMGMNLMKGNLKKINLMGKGFIFIKMEINIQEILKII